MSDPASPPAPSARLLDRSMTHVERRRGVAAAVATLARHVLRRILGLRRPFRYKLLPLGIATVAYLPAIAFLGLAALLPEEFAGEVLPGPTDFYGFILVSVILFTALAGPQTLCPDRAHKTLGLYLASPLDRTTYLAANAASLVVVLLVVTLGPPLLVQGGLGLLGYRGPAVVVLLWRLLASGLVLSLIFGVVALAGASLTERRAFASAGVFLALLGLTIVSQVLDNALDLPEAARMIDVTGLAVEGVSRIYGESAGMPGLGAPTLYAGIAAWVVLPSAFVMWRYRRLAVVR